MDPTLFFIVLIPVAISLAAKFLLRWDISWLEFAAQVLIGLGQDNGIQLRRTPPANAPAAPAPAQ